MPKILIVDDEKDIRELIAVNLMREEAHQILEAEDGLQALRQAKNERPDLIILDLSGHARDQGQRAFDGILYLVAPGQLRMGPGL